ncbi:MAG: NADH:flavin oxidoreductase [Alphaproteobacteria bacterium]|nr:NADH:flavin oxidoreductase [Alphaproteobacteria bacterium]
MWKPPEKIKWATAGGEAPSAEQAAGSLLFSPLAAGRLKLRHRGWVPAMVPWRATEDGFVTSGVLDWYGRFARGRPGAIVVEATGIRDVPSGPLLRIGHDRFIEGLSALVERVRQESGGQTRLFIQIIDFLAIRRRPERGKFLTRFLAITDAHRATLGLAAAPEADVRAALLACDDARLQQVLSPREWQDLAMGYRESVNDTHLPHIAELPEVLPDLFAQAAVRAQKAGFDGVELHYAHAYTMASFLSATNQRDDGYGGARENRVRLPLEVYQAVRAATAKDFVTGARFLADEIIEGGNRAEDAAYFAVEFAKAGMDFLSLSRGGKFDDAKQPKAGAAAYPYTGRSGYECMPGHISDSFGPFGRNLEATALIRKAVRDAGYQTPVVAAGGIHNFAFAEKILRDGIGDIIGAARQSLADPDWFLKIERGKAGQVRLCEYTNYCEGLDQNHKQVTCQLWDRIALDEAGAPKTPDGKRRLIPPAWVET